MQRTANLVYVHFVWGTWDRLPLLVGEAKKAIYSCIHSECITFKTEILALGGVEDHIHLLALLPPTVGYAISNQTIKRKFISSGEPNSKRGILQVAGFI